VVSDFLPDGLPEFEPAGRGKPRGILCAVDNFNIGSQFLGVLAPDASATATGDYHFVDPGVLDQRQIFIFQSLVLATEAKIIRIQHAACFRVTENHEMLADRRRWLDASSISHF